MNNNNSSSNNSNNTQLDNLKYRYTNKTASEIEPKWQKIWEKNCDFWAKNPSDTLGECTQNSSKNNKDQKDIAKKFYILDMFPYPSGKGIHVGHPLGYIATDVFSRYKRMKGYNVLHPFGFDAFGLPAEQYAVQTGTHPKISTQENIENMKKQLKQIGFDHDTRREFSTIEPEFVKWTQWIFLKIFNSYYCKDYKNPDGSKGSARPISELIEKFKNNEIEIPKGSEISLKHETEQNEPTLKKLKWQDLTVLQQQKIINSYRLAEPTYQPVNWAPGLGTVLANEEVTADGLSERGNFPVFKKNLQQWTLKITKYSKRLLNDLEIVDWPEKIKTMQRNWIGKSKGASVEFTIKGTRVNVFTTRPDTLFGATFMVLSPEHPLLSEQNLPKEWEKDAPKKWTQNYKNPAQGVSEYKKQAQNAQNAQNSKTHNQSASEKDKTGVWTGLYAINPVNNKKIPVWTADYVMMDYGEGAIMAVPSGDQRDWEFATKFDIPIIHTVEPPKDYDGKSAYIGNGKVINSKNSEISLNGLSVEQAKTTIINWLEKNNLGKQKTTYKLRDWLFSRQRYWGEPFPIVYDSNGMPHAIPEKYLPVELPEVPDYTPKTFEPYNANTTPQAPLNRNEKWVKVKMDLEDGNGEQEYIRDTNTMPNWAGSSWYYLRYIDPNDSKGIGKKQDLDYWLGTNGVDLYVGGVEHAVLHLLYARFWHKVLYDLGVVSTKEPFGKLFNQGYIQAYAYKDSRGSYVPAQDVQKSKQEKDAQEKFFFADANGVEHEVFQEYGKMGKSLKNIVTPEDIIEEYGADTFRLYEMSMGPLEISRPWDTTSIIGSYRFLQRLWRNIVDEETGSVYKFSKDNLSQNAQIIKLTHQTIAGVQEEMENLRFNTAISKLIVLNNAWTKHLAKGNELPEFSVVSFIKMLAPFAPHISGELWQRLSYKTSIIKEEFPKFNKEYLGADFITAVAQINGKVRAKIQVPSNIQKSELEKLALQQENIKELIKGCDIKKIIVVPPKIVNIVL